MRYKIGDYLFVKPRDGTNNMGYIVKLTKETATYLHIDPVYSISDENRIWYNTQDFIITKRLWEHRKLTKKEVTAYMV